MNNGFNKQTINKTCLIYYDTRHSARYKDFVAKQNGKISSRNLRSKFFSAILHVPIFKKLHRRIYFKKINFQLDILNLNLISEINNFDERLQEGLL